MGRKRPLACKMNLSHTRVKTTNPVRVLQIPHFVGMAYVEFHFSDP